MALTIKQQKRSNKDKISDLLAAAHAVFLSLPTRAQLECSRLGVGTWLLCASACDPASFADEEPSQ